MREFNNFRNSLSPRPTRYCVWAVEQTGVRPRLVQLWIDPSMEQFEAEDKSPEVVSAGQEEEPPPVLADYTAHARTVFGGAHLFF